MKAIYIRTSTKEQNPENQLKECQLISNSLSKEEAIVFKDKQSAWKDNVERESFNELKSMMKSYKVKHLIVWDLDRIYRNRKRLISFFTFCKAYGCKVYSYRQRWLEELNKIPEPFDEIMHSLMLQIMGWLAEEESNKKSERIKASIRERGGKKVSYKGNKWGRKKLPLQTISRVLELKSLNPGWSYRKIAEEAYYYDNNKNKKVLSKSTVANILNSNQK